MKSAPDCAGIGDLSLTFRKARSPHGRAVRLSARTTLLHTRCGVLTPDSGAHSAGSPRVRSVRKCRLQCCKSTCLLPWRTALGNAILVLEIRVVARVRPDRGARMLEPARTQASPTTIRPRSRAACATGWPARTTGPRARRVFARRALFALDFHLKLLIERDTAGWSGKAALFAAITQIPKRRYRWPIAGHRIVQASDPIKPATYIDRAPERTDIIRPTARARISAISGSSGRP